MAKRTRNDSIEQETRGADKQSPYIGLGVLLRDTNLAFNRILRAELAEYNITFSQFQHLRHLWEEEGISQVELSGRIGLSKAESTGVINSLEQLGLITRKQDLNDRRRLLVYLTKKSRDLRPALWACAKRVNTMARVSLNETEVSTLFALLERVQKNLKESRTAA